MKNNKGFTLIELIMVTIILGILAAVAIPRYASTVVKAEEAAEDAVISSIRAGLETYGYDATDVDDADSDGEWKYNTTTLKITHQRNDNSRVSWDYDKGTQTGDNADVGTLGSRADL